MRSSYPAPVNLAVFLMSGCASGPPRQTTADLTRARTLVAAAEQGGAQQYAALTCKWRATRLSRPISAQATRRVRPANSPTTDQAQAVGRGEDTWSQVTQRQPGDKQNRRVNIILADMSERFAQRPSQASSRQ